MEPGSNFKLLDRQIFARLGISQQLGIGKIQAMIKIFLFCLVTFSTSRVEADQDPNDDLDLLFWKTVNDGPGLLSVYGNVDLQASSFLAVCLGYHFQSENINVDGQILLETSGSKYVHVFFSHVLFLLESIYDLSTSSSSIKWLQKSNKF